MKTLIIRTVILTITLFYGSAKAQTINWASMKEENKHIVNANFGLDFGVTYGLGYGYQFKIWVFPTIANLEYSVPSGEKKLDDFKTELGLQIRLVEFNNFQLSGKIHGVFRRYECDMVRLINFGSNMSVTVGYYRRIWFVAAEGGIDKSIVTNFKHSQRAKDRYPGVVGGWYQPSTGGNFYYGLQTGFSFWKNDIYVKAGKVINQNLKTTPMLPYYAQVGYNFRFN
jgi:hypothetical protein